MKIKYLVILTLSALMFSANFANAHHSFAATFKEGENNTIEGVVTDFRFRNPHVLIYLDVTNTDGSVTNWMAEGSAATGWNRAGWKADILKPGDMMRITGSATIDGSPMVAIEEMALLNPNTKSVIAELRNDEDPQVSLGREATVTETIAYFLPPTLPSGEPNFTGVTQREDNADPRTGGSGPDGYDPVVPYSEVGKAALEAWDLVNDPQVFCEQPGVVRQAAYTPYGMKINQYPDHVTIEYEEYGSRRSIFFDDELPKPGVRSHMGDSVARYEGDSLVIETVNLLPNASGHRGRPLSDEARVTEVYTRVENPDRGTLLRTDTTVVDPKFLTESWTITRYKLYSANYSFIENECQAPLRERPANLYQYSDFDLQFLD